MENYPGASQYLLQNKRDLRKSYNEIGKYLGMIEQELERMSLHCEGRESVSEEHKKQAEIVLDFCREIDQYHLDLMVKLRDLYIKLDLGQKGY